METSPKQHFTQNLLHLPPSPNAHSPNNSNSSSTCSNNNQQPPPPPPLTPSSKSITRSESNPYPTTFVQANTSSFKQVVQMLTGSSETAKHASTQKPGPDSPPIRNPIPPRRQTGFKLYERRNSAKNFKISPVLPGFKPNQTGFSPRKAEILSPSILDFPALALSPVTPLISDLFNRSPHQSSFLDSRIEEEKVIAEKGFYLHRSPATTPREVEPRLLPLFPVTSPGLSGSSSS